MTTRADGRSALRVVLGDQLSPRISSLADLQPGTDVVLMAAVMAECTYVRHHPMKIAFVLSAMRHFAHALAARGVRVDYIRLDDPENTQSLAGEVARAASRHRPAQIIVSEPGEWRVLTDIRRWGEMTGLDVEVRDDTRFLCRLREFRSWARGKRVLRMESFYRVMRKRTGLLMGEGMPEGGRWNFDAENRKRLPASLAAPQRPAFPPDSITREVLALVRERFGDHFGSADAFSWPVTARDARALFSSFLSDRLAAFGDWQDAMRAGAPFLFHAGVSPALNVGLLDPMEMCVAVEEAYRSGTVPLNSAEGFIRQILGWREFMRGIYWLHMPEYAARNALEATRRLPWFYWSGETRMHCVSEVVRQTQRHGYAHHIQRLMITGNFALLAGIHPDDVDEWYMIVFADAYEWVEMPNTRGMALFADGGIVGSKPYAASGAYINRMSDYCRDCAYDVRDSAGENACPFNFLYWDFIARHQNRWSGNMRMAMPLRNLARMDTAKVAAMRTRAARFLAAMDAGESV